MSSNALGRHIIAEFYDCNSEIIKDAALVEDVMLKSVKISGATIVQPVFHKFSPFGVSGIVVVSESHFSIHTWPEYKYCAVDIFTCGDTIESQDALEYLKENLGCGNVSVVEMKRGFLNLGVNFSPQQNFVETTK